MQDRGRTETVVIQLNYLPTTRDESGRVVSSGIEGDLEHLTRELQVDIDQDQVFDWSLDQFIDSGKYQINLRGSKEAYFGLGRFLIALARHPDEDTGYHVHIDDIGDKKGAVHTHLIIHAPSE
jgi:hypothetical protein